MVVKKYQSFPCKPAPTSNVTGTARGFVRGLMVDIRMGTTVDCPTCQDAFT